MSRMQGVTRTALNRDWRRDVGRRPRRGGDAGDPFSPQPTLRGMVGAGDTAAIAQARGAARAMARRLSMLETQDQ